MRRVVILGAVLVSAFLAPSGASARPPSPCDYWVHGCDVTAYVCDATNHLLGFCLEPNATVPAAKV